MDLKAAVDTAIKLQGTLKDEAFFSEIKEFAAITNTRFTDAAGQALHRLYKTKPSEDTVKQLIKGIPSSLFYRNHNGQLPVQSSVRRTHSVKYLPILAKEGIKHNVGGNGMRGGLLLLRPNKAGQNRNTLQVLANIKNSTNPNFRPNFRDTVYLDAMKVLRNDDLLVKKDIDDHRLLLSSCFSTSKKRFEYLADWDPDCLMTGTNSQDLPNMHHIIKIVNLASFTLYFRSTLKHHAQHIGLLFQNDNDGNTAFERAIQKYDKEKTFKAIRECIPSNTTLPILHHVIRYAPESFNDFSIRYPSTIHLRDNNGRSFTQALLTAGTKTIENDGFFFLRLTDDEIAEIDPVTKQYPFLTAATVSKGDLSTTLFLLSKNPSLLERYREQVTQDRLQEQGKTRTPKRKRDD
eukprot:scaffold3725_cov203-Chaetoceros_neogracile.AAC.2